MDRVTAVARARAHALAACAFAACLLAIPFAATASVFYRFDVVAQTGQNNIVSLGTGPSINSKGKVAFIGRYANGPSVFAWSQVNGATDIATNFLSPNRSFGEAVRLNENDEVLTWNRLLPLGLYEARVFRSATPNDSSVMVRGISGGQPYDLLYQNPAMNSTRVLEDDATALAGNKDGVCDSGETCVSQIAFNAFRSTPARFLGTVIASPQDAADPGQQHEFGLNTSQSHPMMADDGRIVIRGVNSTDSILLFNYTLGAPTAIAGTPTGFTALGASPGITTDGKIVAFAADRGQGAGIFLSIEGAGGVRKVFRIAGENSTVHHPELGVDGSGNPLYFSSLDIDSRVGIIYTPDSQGVANKSIVVSFIGTPNAASRTNPGTGNPFLFSNQKGLWTMRIDIEPELFQNICAVRLPNGGTLAPAGDDQLMSQPGRVWIDAGANGKCETENTYGFDVFFSRGSPLPVVQVGDKIGAGGAHTVSDIAVNDPIAQANFDAALIARAERQGDHRVTFWASIDGGTGQMIVAGDHLDSDQDGLLDHWETQGIDLDGTGHIDLDLPGMGADPFKRDLFVQLDWTADRPLPLNFNGRHRPTVGLIRQLAQYFASAPARADGIAAGIVLHMDAGPTEVDPAGQPFSRNMGIGPVVGGNTVPGGPVDLTYYGQPNSVTVPGVNAVAFDTIKSQVFWTHNRGARELAFMHIVLTDHNGMTDATGNENNANPLQAPVVNPVDAFNFEIPSTFASARILNEAIKITGGKGAGQMRGVNSKATNGLNGNTIIGVDAPLTTQPDATSTIVTFSRSSGEGHAFLRPDGNFLPGRDLDITMGTYNGTPNAEWGSAFAQYATMLHEMGHLFSLTHGGVDHNAYNPSYHSIMSYSYQFCQAPNKGRDINGNVLFTSASCPVQTYSGLDLVSNNWKHFDLRFSQNFAVLSQAFGADPALLAAVPFPPAPEANIDDILALYPPIDQTPPKAAVVTPAGGSTFALGSAISINASATDNVAVTRGEVAFDVNGDGVVDDSEIFVATFTPPSTFTFTLPPTSGPSGARKLAFIAYDAGANPAVATVTINVGSVPPVTVPNVVGQALDVASTTIGAANLAVGAVTYQQSASIATGAVISQAPSGGTSQAAGTPIDLVVSLGPNGVRVPDLKGLSQSAANSALSAAGLTTGTVTTVSTNDPPGVLSQFPLANAIVPGGSAVALLVVVPAGSIAVPNVVGLTQAAASTAITNAGLVVGTVTQQASNTVPAGSVISQSPTAGQLVAAGSAVDLVISSGPGQVSVPNVVGLTQAAATTAITNAGLVVGTVTQQASSIVPAGNVISQNPLAGQLANLASAVDLVISSGPAQVSVPNVVGLTQAAATTAITNAGLVVGTITQQASSIVPAGSVIAQNPLAGQLVTLGSAVNLVISSGPAQVSVPNVVGLTQAAATTAITNAGLVVGTITQQTSITVPAGSVIAQNPTAGQLVAGGSAVDLVVSVGPPVVVPVFTGQTQADAIAAILAAGLQVGNVSLQPSDTVPAGIVLAQNPPAGQQVPAGSRIDLVVSSGVAPLDVPTLSPGLLAVLALVIAATVWLPRRRRR